MKRGICTCIILSILLAAKSFAQCTLAYVQYVTNITQTTADPFISVTSDGSYYIEYGVTGFTPGTGAIAGTGGTLTAIPAGANHVIITGLTLNTSYSIYHRRNCSGNWTANTTTPFNFMSAPDCNTLPVITSGQLVAANITPGQGAWMIGGKELVFKFTAPVSGNYFMYAAVTPEQQWVTYAYKPTSSGCNSQGFSTIGLGVEYNNLQHQFGPLVAGTEYYIMVYSSTSTGSSTFFRIEAPFCSRPGATVTGTTSNSVSISWTGSVSTLEYGLKNFIPGNGAGAGAGGTVVALSGNSYTINNLVQGQLYDFYVRNNCGTGNYSPNSACGLAQSSSCPYFETYNVLGQYKTISPGGVGTVNNYSGCFGTFPGRETYYHFVAPSSGYFKVTISTATSIAHKFLFGTPTFNCALSAYSCLSTDSTSTINGNNYYYTIGPLTAGSYYNLLFDISDTSYSTSTVLGFTITCPPPGNITKSNVQPNSVKLMWTCNSCNSFYLEYGPKGFTPGTGASAGINGTVLTGISPPYILTGLTADTRYDVYLRSSCGANFTANTAVTSFRTAVDCATAPVLNCGDFFTYTGQSEEPVTQGPHSAWTVSGCGNNNNTNKEQIYRFTPSVSGNHSILVYGGFAGSTGYTYAANFYYKVAGSSCTDTGWTCIGTAQSSFPPNWFPPSTITLPSLAAGTTYLILIDGSINLWHFFSFYCRLDCPNTCEMPRIYSVTQTTSTSAEVKMYCDTCFGNLILEYGQAGFTPGPGTIAGAGGTVIAVSTFPYTVTGLASGVTYDFYARHNCGSGSYSTNTAKVTITPCNITPSTVTSNATNNTICAGSSVTLTQNGGALATGGSFKWYTGSCGGTLVGSGNSITVSPTVNTTYYVRAEAACGNSTCRSISISINSTSLPSANITPSGNVNLCSTSGNILQANTGTGLIYQWQKNGVNIPGATSSNYTVTASATYTVVVTNSCGSATSAGTVVTLSTAIPATPAGISATGGNTKMCPGDTKVYSISTVTGATSYTWTPPIGATITAGQGTKTVTVNYTVAFTASDTIRVKANNACGSSAQRILKITRNTPSTPSAITGSAFGVCNLSNVPYSITSVAGMTYSWSFNTGTANVASGQGTNAITASFNSGYATGTLSVNANNACGTSANRTLSIKAIPATPASITGAATVCANQQGVPYSISPIASAVNYTWSGPTGSHVSDGTTTSSGTNLITTATNVTLNYGSTAGKINARANNACGSGSYKNITVTFTCREVEQADSFNESSVIIQPNPSTGIFEMIIPSVQNKNTEIEIYSPDGRLIKKQTSETNNTFLIDLTRQADGIYFVHALVEGHLISKKIVKQ